MLSADSNHLTFLKSDIGVVTTYVKFSLGLISFNCFLMKHTMKHKKSIGFFNFFPGIISTKWKEVQRQYCAPNKLKYSNTWSKHLINSFLQHPHLMCTSRCRILHLHNIGTFEHTLRQHYKTTRAGSPVVAYFTPRPRTSPNLTLKEMCLWLFEIFRRTWYAVESYSSTK